MFADSVLANLWLRYQGWRYRVGDNQVQGSIIVGSSVSLRLQTVFNPSPRELSGGYEWCLGGSVTPVVPKQSTIIVGLQ